MPWKPKIAISDLEREKHQLQMRLLKVNAELRLKTLYCEKLEIALHQRNERVDQLYSLLERARQQNQKLDTENEHLASLIANDHRSQAHIETRPEAP